MKKYQIVSDYIGDGIVSLETIQDFVSDWEYDGWALSLRIDGDELLLEAEAIDEDRVRLPREFKDYGDGTYFMVIAEEV